jgi:hypothetical protein
MHCCGLLLRQTLCGRMWHDAFTAQYSLSILILVSHAQDEDVSMSLRQLAHTRRGIAEIVALTLSLLGSQPFMYMQVTVGPLRPTTAQRLHSVIAAAKWPPPVSHVHHLPRS